MKRTMKIIGLLLLAQVMVLFSVMAQTEPTSGEDPQVFVNQLSWLNAIAVPAVLLLTELIKTKVWPQIPKTILPVIAVAIGTGLQYLGSLTFDGVDFTVLASVLNGSLGVLSHDTLKGFIKDAGLNGKS